MEAKEFYISEMTDAIRDKLSEMSDIELDTPTICELGELVEAIQEDDALTGNIDGSHYFNRNKAREVIDNCHLLWCDEFIDYVKSVGKSMSELLHQGEEAVDVYARCWAMSELIDYSDIEELIKDEKRKRFKASH